MIDAGNFQSNEIMCKKCINDTMVRKIGRCLGPYKFKK